MVLRNVGISYSAKDADTLLGNYFWNNSNQTLRDQASGLRAPWSQNLGHSARGMFQQVGRMGTGSRDRAASFTLTL